MSRIISLVLICIINLISITNLSSQDLESGFKNPPASAKARTWWHWINGNVSKEGITADLEAMKQVGIQEAQIFNVEQSYPEGSASFMTPEWLECFRFAVSEAERLGLEIGFHNGAGWSSSGGPWITPEYAMQTVVFSETHYKGKKKIKETITRPQTKLGYYKDIIVLAFPTPKGKSRIDDLELKTLSDHSFKSHLYPDLKHIDKSSLIYQKDIINLTKKMSANGILEWDVPAGEWTVLRIGHTPNGTENRPAGIGGLGLECDKLSRAALDVFWAGGVQPIIDKLGSLVGSSLTNCLIDSYEVGCNNWTSGFDNEFKQRRGYDCMAFLPALAGYYVESGEITERFLWDFRKTIGDLIADNYYGYFTELCHKYGMKSSIEPYGGPFDCMQVGAKGDIVMSEFWIGNKVFLDSPKLVASIASLKGASIVGAESFTSYGGWLNHPTTLKQTGDWVWTEGVNRLIFHTYVHQPWNIAPGVTFHMYGIEMSRLNTWWKQGRAYMDYIARSQYMLQQGRSVTDVLVFVGESSPNDGILRPDIKALGYDYDEIGANDIMSLAVKDGWIHTPVGGIYRVMALPKTNFMTPELLQKINELVKAGAIILGEKPEKSPSLTKFPECDNNVVQLANEIWNNNEPFNDKIVKGKVITEASVEQALKAVGLVPNFNTEKGASDLNFIHRKAGDTDIYFVANPKRESRNEICYFRVTGKRPQFWNPQTGEIRDAAVWKEETNGTTSVPVSFDPDGSVFVVFQKHETHSKHIVQTKIELDKQEMKPLPDLKIIRAEYGIFLPDGVVDVTETVNNMIKNGNLTIHANNSLASADPASGSIKELRVEYEIDNKRHQAQVIEHTPLVIKADNSKNIQLVRAVYGKFPQDLVGIPKQYPITDVTSRIRKMIDEGQYIISADDSLIGTFSSGNTPKKEMRIAYSAEGDIYNTTVAEGNEINLALSTPESKLLSKDGKVTWITPYSGRLSYVSSLGSTKTVQVESVPAPVELTGKWEIIFNQDKNVIFNNLTSWSLSDDESIRYFSGTAIYKKQFSLTKDHIQPDRSLELDLGSVRVIAEVIVNGRNLGILWNAPFRINLDGYVHEGINELEIQVTNLWPNRLIGDEHLPDDLKWGDWTLKNWPDWLINKTERHSKRVTFTTWKHWNKDSKLQISGLLGAVYVRSYVRVDLFE